MKWYVERSYSATLADRVVVEANTEQEAIEKVKQGHFDEIITDTDVAEDLSSTEIVEIFPEDQGSSAPKF